VTWTVEFSPDAARWLRKADPPTAGRIRAALVAVTATGNPRCRGKALAGSLAGLWRYRVGDHRIICDIHDARLVVVILDIGNRDHVDG